MAIFAFVARSLQQVSTLAMTLLAARFLDPAGYGIYSLGIVFVVLIQTLTYTGFYQFILNAKEDHGIVLSTCFWLIFGLVSLASLLLALAAYPIEWLFEAKNLGTVILLLALIQPLASVGAWSSAALLRRRAIMLNFKIMFAQNLIALVGGSVLLWFWHSLFALVAFRYLRVISGTVLYAMFGRDWPKLQFDRTLAKRATAFSSGLYASRFLGFLARYAGDILLGLLYSASAVGLYRFGNRVATGVTDTLTQPMSNFAATQFGGAARNNKDLALPLRRFAGTISLLTGLAGAVLIVHIHDVIELFFKPPYMAALMVTYAMALRALAGTGQLLIEPVFAALQKTGWVMMFNFVTAVVSVIGIIIATPFGLEILAWTQALLVLGTTAWAFYIIQARGGVRVSGAVGNFTMGVILSVCYGLIIASVRFLLLPEFVDQRLPLLIFSLLIASVVGFAFLALGILLRTFSLKAFSG